MNLPAASNSDTHQFHFTTEDFERIRRLIYQHVGIALGPSKQAMVYSRLSRRLRIRGLSRFEDYLSLLENGDAAEWEAFTNSLTTNLTAFFREEHHFSILAEHVRIQKNRPIELWCCASSTGEEPYSIAMSMVEAFGVFTPPVRILATDVDTQALAKAQAGIYPLKRLEKMHKEKIKRFFLKGAGKHDGMVRVRRELQDMVTFRQINLLDPSWPVRGIFNAIFCRNVMIYFDKATQRRILEKFVPLLPPNGLLFAGHSESFHHAADLFRPCGKTVYQLSANSGGRRGSSG